jgi:hypothetical protein
MKRIRYISTMTKPIPEDEIQELVEMAQKHNEQKKITGMLVATDSKFYQLIEGPEQAIDTLYKRIEKDPRHQNVKLLYAESGCLDRLCPNWSMLKIDLTLVDHEKLAPAQALLNIAISKHQLLEDTLKDLEKFTLGAFTDSGMAENNN